MAEYLTPGVFIEDIPSAAVIEGGGTTTGAFVGITQRGKVGVPVYITSWNDFVEKFAKGMDSPFMMNSDLAYSLYGFFQNGGSKCYIVRAATENAKAAKAVFGEDSNIDIEAKDEGEWGNTLTLTIKANAENFDLTVTYSEDETETFTGLSNTITDNNYWVDVVNNESHYITGVSGSLAATTDTITFSGGNDGIEGIADTDFIKALHALQPYADNLNMLAIPGQTAAAIYAEIISFCENNKYVFGILEAPEAATLESVKTLREGLSSQNVALYYPWVRVSDPLSTNGRYRECPPSGHIMGVYVRTILERGVHKAPAGTSAIVRGVIEVTKSLSVGETDILNPLCINAILAKPNYGIVLWGARNLGANSAMKYISDVLLDMYIKKSVYNGTQPYVFEPNDEITWIKITTTISAFMDSVFSTGALAGSSPTEAYYVKCDASLNTKEVRDAGKLLCEVGYANKKPSEFIIFRFSHEVSA